MYGLLTGRAVTGWAAAIILSTLIGVFFAGEIDSTEDGPLERLQVAILIAVVFLFAWLAVRLERTDPSDRIHHPIFAAAIATGAILLIGREISWFRIYGLEREWADPIKYLGWALCIGVFVFVARRLCRAIRLAGEMNLFLKRTGPYLLAAIGLLGFGDLFEKHLFPADHSQHYAELFELLGYLTVLYAGAVSRAETLVQARPQAGAAKVR